MIKLNDKKIIFASILFSLFIISNVNAQIPEKISQETKTCIGCHEKYTPGIYKDWMVSRHAAVTPGEGMGKSILEKRVSSDKVPERFLDNKVGCYECHTMNSDDHEDTFDHFGFKVHPVVTPKDCATCHEKEVEQYSGSIKANAYDNLIKNPVYMTLVETTTNLAKFETGELKIGESSENTKHETCLGCHGTKLEVVGTKEVISKGLRVEVPDIKGWPSQGVGRINPDGSKGSCSSCHPRHKFSLEDARKPYTCAQCHLDPDVPAWNVYKESKHGNIYSARWKHWNFEKVPWVPGKDFKAPTCATCHNSLLVDENGKVIVERTHDFGSRLWVRIFGLIYTHPHPKEGATHKIKNQDGLPLPTTFDKKVASEFLIDEDEQSKRKQEMMSICKECHSTQWVQKHFEKMDKTIEETDEMVLTATLLLVEAWNRGLADKANPFDEEIEKKWVEQWLFYANSIRYASAMTGAPDYATFKNGWWELNRNLQSMKNDIETLEVTKKKGAETTKGVCGPTAILALFMIPALIIKKFNKNRKKL